MLQQCRQYLLSVQSRSLPEPEDLPNIYLLISPLFADESDLGHGFMNTVLSGTCFAIATNSPKAIIQSHYFLIHIGAINILVKFSPLKDVELPMEFCINRQGGNYYIPPESTRKACLPQGMWSLFQLLAQANEKLWLEASGSQSFENKVVNQPATSAALAYGITSGRDSELQKIAAIGLQPSPDPNIPKVINFLPNQFYVRPFQQNFHQAIDYCFTKLLVIIHLAIQYLLLLKQILHMISINPISFGITIIKESKSTLDSSLQ